MNRKLRVKIIEVFDTQSDFAQAINERESVISKIVRERRTLPPEKQAQWAMALGCQPKDIFEAISDGE